jgi:hypothetical protein
LRCSQAAEKGFWHNNVTGESTWKAPDALGVSTPDGTRRARAHFCARYAVSHHAFILRAFLAALPWLAAGTGSSTASRRGRRLRSTRGARWRLWTRPTRGAPTLRTG